MTLIIGSATVPSSSTVAVFSMPAGVSNAVFFQPNAAAATVYLGTSARLTVINGLPVSSTPVSQDYYNTSKGVTYYATTGSATASSFSYVISTAAGI